MKERLDTIQKWIYFDSMSSPVRKLVDQWGREIDQDSWSWPTSLPPQSNPDDTTSDEHYDISQNPQVVAGMQFADVSQLFVSARGLKDDDGNQTFPPQVMWTTPELANDEILDCVAWQFDEEFEGGFSEIIRSTDNPCKTYGHIPIEYEWCIREKEPFKGKAFVKMAYARDPHKYRYDIDGKPGIYQNTGFGKWKRMNPQNFQSYAHNPLFNSPYGTSINLPLKPWIETFTKVFGYWRHALEKTSMGAWVASCPDAWFTQNGGPQAQLLAKTFEKVKEIAAGTASCFPASAELDNKKLQLEAQALLDWYTSFCEVCSLIHTGTTGALKEEEYGSRAAKESTDVREKSQREQFNAARVSNFWTCKFIPLFCSVNFAPTYALTPVLQLIPPNLITPTTPKDQDTQEEIQEGGPQEREKIEVTTKKGPEEKEMQGLIPWGSNSSSVNELQERMLKEYNSWHEYKPQGNHAELQEEDEEKPYTPPTKKELQREEKCPWNHTSFPNLTLYNGDYIELSENYKGHVVFLKHENNDFDRWQLIHNRLGKITRIATALELAAGELQEENEEKPYTPPVAVPPGYVDFPSQAPLPPGYRDEIETAQQYLGQMPAISYPNVPQDQAHAVFTIKRLRSLTEDGILTEERESALLSELKLAIIPTLAANNEDQAWRDYWKSAIGIFQRYGITQPSPELRNDLTISFRQARQNALNEGFYQSVLADDNVIGVRIVNDPNVKQHHETHPLWHNIALPKTHEELRLGGKLRIPMDFGCQCHYEKVYQFGDLTPIDDYPHVWPGHTYRFYAAGGGNEP